MFLQKLILNRFTLLSCVMEWGCPPLFSRVFVLWSFHPVSTITLLSAFVYLFILKFQFPSFPHIYLLLALLNEGERRSVSIVDTPAMNVWVSYASNWGAPIPYLSPHALRLDALHVIHAPTCMLLVALELVCEHCTVLVLWWGCWWWLWHIQHFGLECVHIFVPLVRHLPYLPFLQPSSNLPSDSPALKLWVSVVDCKWGNIKISLGCCMSNSLLDYTKETWKDLCFAIGFS